MSLVKKEKSKDGSCTYKQQHENKKWGAHEVSSKRWELQPDLLWAPTGLGAPFVFWAWKKLSAGVRTWFGGSAQAWISGAVW